MLSFNSNHFDSQVKS